MWKISDRPEESSRREIVHQHVWRAAINQVSNLYFSSVQLLPPLKLTSEVSLTRRLSRDWERQVKLPFC
jgi:hypothetical protein